MQLRQPRPTLRDVAEAAGVSKTTAVFVLNERPNFAIPDETRTRVQNAAQHLGYRRNGLAAALSQGKTGSLGIVVNMSSAARDPQVWEDYLLGILLGATRAASDLGLRLTTIAYNADAPPAPDTVTDRRVDGLILVGVQEAFARAVYATDVPCVTLGSGYARRRVTADNQGGAAQAVEHLVALGHRRIAYASSGQTEADRERGQGWANTLHQHDLPTDDLENDWKTLFARVLSRAPDRPTAIFCRNDGCASFLMQAARENGLRVPEDFSLVGFDSGIVAHAMGLTSVRNPLGEQAARAAEMLTRLIAGDTVPDHVSLPTELVVRHSTAAFHA